MKIAVIAYSNFNKLALWIVVGLFCAMAVAIFILAGTGDTTALGDPYYEDTILAPDRAFIPWALCLLTLIVIVVIALSDWFQRRKA